MKVLPFTKRGDPYVQRAEKDKELVVRSIRLPAYVWEALDGDAERCRRSPVRQLEALLVRYYELDPNVELNEEALNEVAHAVSGARSKRKG